MAVLICDNQTSPTEVQCQSTLNFSRESMMVKKIISFALLASAIGSLQGCCTDTTLDLIDSTAIVGCAIYGNNPKSKIECVDKTEPGYQDDQVQGYQARRPK